MTVKVNNNVFLISKYSRNTHFYEYHPILHTQKHGYKYKNRDSSFTKTQVRAKNVISYIFMAFIFYVGGTSKEQKHWSQTVSGGGGCTVTLSGPWTNLRRLKRNVISNTHTQITNQKAINLWANLLLCNMRARPWKNGKITGRSHSDKNTSGKKHAAKLVFCVFSSVQSKHQSAQYLQLLVQI